MVITKDASKTEADGGRATSPISWGNIPVCAGMGFGYGLKPKTKFSIARVLFIHGHFEPWMVLIGSSSEIILVYSTTPKLYEIDVPLLYSPGLPGPLPSPNLRRLVFKTERKTAAGRHGKGCGCTRPKESAPSCPLEARGMGIHADPGPARACRRAGRPGQCTCRPKSPLHIKPDARRCLPTPNWD